MKGIILGYYEEKDCGAISGDDGVRYKFVTSDFMGQGLPIVQGNRIKITSVSLRFPANSMSSSPNASIGNRALVAHFKQHGESPCRGML